MSEEAQTLGTKVFNELIEDFRGWELFKFVKLTKEQREEFLCLFFFVRFAEEDMDVDDSPEEIKALQTQAYQTYRKLLEDRRISFWRVDTYFHGKNK